jgi:hypothetical protein
VTLPDVTLLGGDVDQDDHISLTDGFRLTMLMFQEPVDEPWYRVRDITDDGVVDILDVVAVQFNWDARAPGPWPDTGGANITDAGATKDDVERGSPSLGGHLQAAPRGILGWSGAANDEVVVKIDPQTARAEGLGVPIRLDIAVEDVEDLSAFAVKVRFDPTVLRVRDADPGSAGTQVVPGDFLDFQHWVILWNQADNEAGLVDLAIAQAGQTPGQDGSGVLGSIIFEGINEGTSEVRFEEIELLAMDWPWEVPIPAVGQNGTVTIASSQRFIYLPIVLKSYP